jgi:hypothetical protein
MSRFETGPHVVRQYADRLAMIPDLLLALASVAVLLSPVVVDAGKCYELQRNKKMEDDLWEPELPL